MKLGIEKTKKTDELNGLIYAMTPKGATVKSKTTFTDGAISTTLIIKNPKPESTTPEQSQINDNTEDITASDFQDILNRQLRRLTNKLVEISPEDAGFVSKTKITKGKIVLYYNVSKKIPNNSNQEETLNKEKFEDQNVASNIKCKKL